MDKKEFAKKIQIQKEHYANVSEDCACEDKRANSNHYYKIEQMEKGFYDHLISRRGKKRYNFMEIGVGTGIHAEHFLNAYSNEINKFVACDLSEAMLNVSKIRLEKYKNIIEFYQSAAEEVELETGMDGVYISGSMHHFASPYQAISNVKNILNKNGVLIICEPNVWNPYNFIRVLKEGKSEIGQFTTARRNNIRKYLKELDFCIVQDNVLHYRSGWKLLRKFWPYEKLNRYKVFDLLSIMFLFVTIKR